MSTTTLLLLRHGIAEEPREGLDDADRALTERGRQRTRLVLERLLALGCRADRLLCSPLRRARQTAEIAVATGWAPQLSIDDALAPAGEPLACLPAWIQVAADCSPHPLRLALVGHEPDLSALAAQLIGAPAGALGLRKAGLLELALPTSFPQGHAVLQALLRPGLLLE